MSDHTVEVVAVGGPGDGRRYTIASDTKAVRVFSRGPMRGNVAPKGVHLLEGTYTEYDIAEFGIVGEASVILLKPVGSTLVNIMTLLSQVYRGMERSEFERIQLQLREAAIAHVAGLLRETQEWVEHDGDTFGHGNTERRADLLSRLETFFAAYDQQTSEAISAPRALQ